VRTDLVDIVLALIVLFTFLLVWRREGDDPVWQERWRALSPADRSLPLGIALMAGGLLADSGVFIAFGVLFTLGGIWGFAGGFRLRRALRETISRDRAHTNRIE